MRSERPSSVLCSVRSASASASGLVYLYPSRFVSPAMLFYDLVASSSQLLSHVYIHVSSCLSNGNPIIYLHTV